jgi:hypothetical protein
MRPRHRPDTDDVLLLATLLVMLTVLLACTLGSP